MNYLFLVLAFITNGAANVLLKMGADRGVSLDMSQGIVRLLAAHAHLLAGLALFAVNVVLYVIALRSFPLSVAYPIMVGMSFVVANIGAVLFLHEPVSWQHLLGYALILSGITVVVGYVR